MRKRLRRPLRIIYQLKSLWVCLCLIGLQNAAPAQNPDKAYCDSLLMQGVEAVLEKKNHTDGLLLLEGARNIAVQNRWFMQQFLALNNLEAV